MSHIEISPELSRRRSPYSFDKQRGVASSDIEALFEAARWAPSAFNDQPWRYIVGVRERSPQVYAAILDTLVPANQIWAQHAPVLALGLIRSHFEHNGEFNSAAQHDLGAASAGLTVEATRRGLAVHQMKGFEPDKVRSHFEVGDLEPFTALAVGYAGDSAPNEELARREQQPRTRKPLDEIVIAGGF